MAYIARTAGKEESRSEVIERLLQEAIETRSRKSREDKDAQILDKYSRDLNREADDVLDYQGEP